MLRKTFLKLFGGLLVLASVITIITIVVLKSDSGLYFSERLDLCLLDHEHCFDAYTPPNIDKILKEHTEYIIDGKLNTQFFRKFRHHFSLRVSNGDLTELNEKLYQEFTTAEISEPKGKLQRAGSEYERANATFVALVRDKELKGILQSVKEIEETFNGKFHYPWTFISDKPFSNRFVKKIKQATESECEFVMIDGHRWRQPKNIDLKKQEEGSKYLKSKNIQYADQVLYHNMCRFFSGVLHTLPEMQKYRYYWRVEPSVHYYCDIDYDVFKFMEDQGKTYGFGISLYDEPETVRSLWDTTVKFLEQNFQYVHPNASFDWLLQDIEHPEHNTITNGYSTCHFWLNFEIADMDFFRGEAYTKWFKYLDNNGGFYYERWGDAPVHSIGLGLFEDKSKIHWFRDIGYFHHPYFHCPNSDKCHGKCTPGEFALNLKDKLQNCMGNWIRYSMLSEERSAY